MICKTCGTEIDNSVTVCPVCGTPASEPVAPAPQQPAYQQPQQPAYQQPQQPAYQQPQQPAYQQSQQLAYQQPQQSAYQQPQNNFQSNPNFLLDQYVQLANSISSIAIGSIVGSLLCGIVGIVCIVMSFIKIKNLPVIAPETLDQGQMHRYQEAQKKVQTAKTMNIIAIVLFVLSILAGIVVTIFSTALTSSMYYYY